MPRPRFTLRVVLVVTAIVAVVAWQGSIVQQRRAAMGSDHEFVLERLSPPPLSGYRPARVNALRALLGDEPVRFIYLRFGDGEWQVERDRIERLFPEARIEMGTVHAL